MFDCGPGKERCKLATATEMKEKIVEESTVQALVRPNPVQSLLEHHPRHLVLPQSTPPRFATLAHHDVARLKSVTLQLVVLEPHLTELIQIELAPSNVHIRKVR
jgi:hypothetical protein